MSLRPATGFRCPRCADCCRVVRVPLTDADLRRLNAGTGIEPAALVEWLGPDDIDMTGEPETFVALRPGRRLMVLKHGSDGCQFLTEERCSVYPHRPSTCAAYPFELSEGPGVPSVIRLPGAICEPDALPAPEEVSRANGLVTEELRSYAERVVEWNRQQRRRTHLHRLPAEAPAFFQFLGF